MPMSSPRWTAIAESQFPWEREALDWLRAELPDRDPWHAWTNFEFIDDDGKVNEVDALILSPGGLFLVEIKSRPGCSYRRSSYMDVDDGWQGTLLRQPADPRQPQGQTPSERSQEAAFCR